MNDYDVIPDLKYLKPLRFKKYSILRRYFANLVITFTIAFLRPKKGLKMKYYKIRGYKHNKIKVIVFRHEKQDKKAPGLLYIHGGGFQMAGTPVHIRMLMNIILQTGQTAVYVKYRLLPNNPFPAALYDTYHALLWMKAHADFLRIDSKDLSVMGDSAGGNLAIGASLLARDKDGPKVSRVALLYPVIDVKQETKSIIKYTDTPMWNSILNKSMWDLYLKNGDHGMLEYASPSLADLKGFPKTYIETAEYDCLRDEGIQFAEQLKKAGVEVEEHHTKKTVHGYDAMFLSKFVKEMINKRIKFLKGDLNEEN